MDKRESIIEKFKVLLETIFPVEIQSSEEVLEEKQEVTLSEVTLEDGTVISFQTLEIDQPINVINQDGTYSPLADGVYEINEYNVTVVAGVITEVTDKPIETETPEAVVVIPNTEMAEEKPSEEDIQQLIDAKVEEVKLSYEEKLKVQKADFEAQIEAIGNKFKETEIIQAPREETTAPKTYKDVLLANLEAKRKERMY